MKVKDILDRATLLYHDVQYSRLKPVHYLRFLDDAIIQTILVRPDAHEKRTVLKLDPGPRQKLPKDGLSLIDIYSNIHRNETIQAKPWIIYPEQDDPAVPTKPTILISSGSDGESEDSPHVLAPLDGAVDVASPVRIVLETAPVWVTGKPVFEVARKDLDYFSNWYGATPATESINEFAFDVRTPKDFWVNPPVGTDQTLHVEIKYSYVHLSFAELVETLTVEEILDQKIDLSDAFRNALTWYVLYLCYSTDSTAQGDQAIAQSYLKSFFQSLQTDFASSLMATPRIIEPTTSGLGLHLPTPPEQEAFG